LRATQFHELIEKMLRAVSRWPAALLPLGFRFQSVAAAEVAARAVELLDAEPLGRAPDFGGSQVLAGGQMLADWRAVRGGPRAVIGVRLPGEVARGFTQGRNACPDHADGRQTWAGFLAQA
jgi:hypothetical protein